MKKITFTFFLILPLFIFSQNKIGKVAEQVQSAQIEQKEFKPFDIFKSSFENARNNYSKETNGGVIVSFDKEGVASIYDKDPKQIQLNIPFKENGETISLDLIQVEIFAPNFKVTTSDGRDITNEMDRGKHYRGTVTGNSQSLVSISVFKNEVVGFITNGEGNYAIGKLKDSSTKHIIYKDSNLRTAQEFICETPDDDTSYSVEQLTYDSSNRLAGGTVEVYVEAGQSVLNSFAGNMTLTTNFLNGVFGQSYALYANEGILMQTSSMFIWTTPDPYTFNSSGQQLSAFQSQTGAFQGDIGHLVEVQNIGGIAAGFSGLCNQNTDNSLCFSGFSGNTFSNIPTVSFNVFLITHEMGHLLGSRHTHACVWNGDNTAIDGCAGYTEGACALPGSPAGGGTIMSYCINTVGLDFTQGFGPQPGAVILNNVNNANCVTTPCTGPEITCPEDTGVPCGANTGPANTGTAVATADAGCGQVTVSFLDVITPGNCPGNYTITRTWTATDAQGNQSQCDQTITVKDTTPPTSPPPPASVTVQCADDVPPPVELTATDWCSGNITVSPTEQITPGNCDNQFTISRTWTFVDGCGNTAYSFQTINVNDTTPPELTIPADEIAECDKVPAVGQASATDNCDDNVDAVYDGEERIDGDCINNYTLIRTWTATDNCGNSTTKSQTITVQDTTAPWIKTTVNDFIDLGCNIDEGSVPKPEVHLNGSDLIAGDNCEGEVTIEYNRKERTTDGCENRIIYYYKAIDACGNETAREDFASFTYYWEEDVITECQPTFAYNKDAATCFSSDPNLNTNQFGWSNYFDAPGEYTLRLYWDPGQCDPWSGQDTIGVVNINYTGEQITAEYRLNFGYTMSDIALYIGCDAFPVNDYGESTIEYDAYNFNLTDLGYISSYTVGPIQVNSPNGIHVIANAETCYQKCRCTKSEHDGGTFTPTGDDANVDCNKDRLNDNDLDLSNKVSLFPNPVENILTIGNPQQLELTSADIFDMTGRKVLSFNLKNMGVAKDLDLTKLPSAAYFITIKGVDGQLTKPIVKE